MKKKLAFKGVVSVGKNVTAAAQNFVKVLAGHGRQLIVASNGDVFAANRMEQVTFWDPKAGVSHARILEKEVNITTASDGTPGKGIRAYTTECSGCHEVVISETKIPHCILCASEIGDEEYEEIEMDVPSDAELDSLEEEDFEDVEGDDEDGDDLEDDTEDEDESIEEDDGDFLEDDTEDTDEFEEEGDALEDDEEELEGDDEELIGDTLEDDAEDMEDFEDDGDSLEADEEDESDFEVGDALEDASDTEEFDVEDEEGDALEDDDEDMEDFEDDGDSLEDAEDDSIAEDVGDELDDEDCEIDESCEDDATGEEGDFYIDDEGSVNIDLVDGADVEEGDECDVEYSASMNGSKRWIASVNGMPVATATQENSGSNKEIFHTDSFGKVARQVIASSGISGLKELGFTSIVISAPVRGLIQASVDAEIAKAEGVVEKKLTSLASDFQTSMGMAAAGINRGFFGDVVNPLKVRMWEELSSLGIPQPQRVIDRVFKETAEDFCRVLIEKASELQQKPEAVRVELSKAITGSNYLAVAEDETEDDVEDVEEDGLGDELASRIEASSMPFGNVVRSNVVEASSTVGDSFKDSLNSVFKSL